jgi:hypothetical protein
MHRMHATTHTHTHTHTLQTIETTGQLPTPPACRTPIDRREVLRRSSGAARKDSCTACERTAFTPCRRTHLAVAGGEKSPPAHGRTDVSPLHALHSSPIDTPASTRALRLDDGRSPPPRRAQRLCHGFIFHSGNLKYRSGSIIGSWILSEIPPIDPGPIEKETQKPVDRVWDFLGFFLDPC